MQLLFLFEGFIALICLVLIINRIYGEPFNKGTIISLLVYPIAIVGVPFIDYQTFMLCYPLLLAYNVVICKVLYHKINLGSIVYTIILLLTTVTTFTATIVAFFPNQKAAAETIAYIILLCICLLIAHTKVKYKLQLIKNMTPRFLKTIILILLIITSITSTMLFSVYDRASNPNWVSFLQLLILIMMVFVFALFPIVISHAINNQHLKQLTANYQKQIQAQAEHYEALAKSNFELRRFRHDFKNVWIGLNQLIQSNQSQEALELLENYHTSVVQTTNGILPFDTGNGIVDALLTDKYHLAQKINTNIVFEGMVPPKGISATDLCVLFGNTVDNALEACEKFPADKPKAIHIKCQYAGGFLLTYISNPVVENISIRNNSIPTTKEDKALHGFGLYSLEQIVKKHDGQMKLTCNDYLFEASIDLCVTQA